ncbi:hypothetical protein M407DRAFT_17762 [Tulasnella calospora MUT 4182]|uniref:Uncharacterized protein n=1 Tax=Tulasnella calospora MUT 4182 TaxID=1051891 RepID=A0A0C3QVB7_9AGAM|nr:hypothetical protein M407DRAFT_17762 [Tulasnella calospora MUT 4182]
MQTNVPTKNHANPQPASVQPRWIPMGLYVLVNKMTGTIVDLDAGCTQSGAPCVGWSRNFNQYIDHQLWVITRNNVQGSYRIMSYRAGTYLDLISGKPGPKSQVAAYNYVGNGDSHLNQEWWISSAFGTKYYTIECARSQTLLEIANGKIINGTPVTCSPPNHQDHQLWELQRVSRTQHEIQDIIKSWKPALVGHLVQPFADDVQYLILPSKLRGAIYDETNLFHQAVRKGTFDYGDFVIKAKDAVKTWARDRFRLDGYSVLFGIVYGNASKGPKAYNWYLSPETLSLVFFDPQTNKEYTKTDLHGFGFEPTFAVL